MAEEPHIHKAWPDYFAMVVDTPAVSVHIGWVAWKQEIALREGIAEWMMVGSCSSWLRSLVNWDLSFVQRLEVVGKNILQLELVYDLAVDEVGTVKAFAVASFAAALAPPLVYASLLLHGSDPRMYRCAGSLQLERLVVGLVTRVRAVSNCGRVHP
jgi:hypothetical protein